MCRGENCELKETCYRYTAPIDEFRQSVFTETPTEKPCKHFWDNTELQDGRKIGKWWRKDKVDEN